MKSLHAMVGYMYSAPCSDDCNSSEDAVSGEMTRQAALSAFWQVSVLQACLSCLWWLLRTMTAELDRVQLRQGRQVGICCDCCCDQI